MRKRSDKKDVTLKVSTADPHFLKKVAKMLSVSITWFIKK